MFFLLQDLQLYLLQLVQALRYELIPDCIKASEKQTADKDKDVDDEELSNIIADSNESSLGRLLSFYSSFNVHFSSEPFAESENNRNSIKRQVDKKYPRFTLRPKRRFTSVLNCRPCLIKIQINRFY